MTTAAEAVAAAAAHPLAGLTQTQLLILIGLLDAGYDSNVAKLFRGDFEELTVMLEQLRAMRQIANGQ